MSITLIGYLGVGSTEDRDPSLPHICTGELVKKGALTASTTETGRSVLSVRSPTTYQGWKPTASTSSITVALAAASSLDYMALFGTLAGITITAAYSLDGSAYTTLGDVQPGSNGAVLMIDDTITNVTHIRWSFTGGIPVIYNASAGMSFIPENGLPVGFAPGALNAEDEYTNTVSEGGQILGRAVTRSGMTEKIDIDAIERTWVDTYWLELRRLLRTEGAYVAWNPLLYPRELVYGMLSASPSVSYSDPLYMAISLEFKGPTYA